MVRSNSRLGEPICREGKDILAQVHHAVETEYAMTIADYLLRRTPLGLEPSRGMGAVDTIATEMGRLLGWSEQEMKRQAAEYRRLVEGSHPSQAVSGA